MPERTIGDWFADRLSPFRRRLKAFQQDEKDRYIPANMRSRQAYTYIFMFLVGFSFINWGLAHFYTYGDFLQFVTINVPLYAIVILFGSYSLTNWLWHRAGKCKPGRFPTYTIIERLKYHRIEPILYKDRQNYKHVRIFELMRCGGLIDGVIDGNGPVVVAPVIQTDVAELMEIQMEQYNPQNGKMANVQLPPIPTAKQANLAAGVEQGGEYIIPGDFEMFLLGNKNDGLDPLIRKWIKETYTDLTPNCIVLMSWSTTAVGPIIEHAPVVHDSEVAWKIADQARQIHELRIENKRLRKYVSKGRKTELGFEEIEEEEA